jgi:hypothetical protein
VRKRTDLALTKEQAGGHSGCMNRANGMTVRKSWTSMHSLSKAVTGFPSSGRKSALKRLGHHGTRTIVCPAWGTAHTVADCDEKDIRSQRLPQALACFGYDEFSLYPLWTGMPWPPFRAVNDGHAIKRGALQSAPASFGERIFAYMLYARSPCWVTSRPSRSPSSGTRRPTMRSTTL